MQFTGKAYAGNIKETEAKILDIDRAALERRLVELGAERVFDGQLDAVFFDFPDRRLAARGALLRLRRDGCRVWLTSKLRRPETDVKVRDELEVEVSDFDGCAALLRALGLEPTSEVTKRRVSWRLGAARCEIDQHEGELAFIPAFLEVEADSADAVRAVAGRLGFAPDQLRPWGLTEVIEHYKARI